jgi:molybdenum cofactor cytidylyltransferase
MGQPKLSLLLGGKTVLQRVIQSLHEAGVERTVVVLGPQVHALAEVVKADMTPGTATVDWLLLEDQTPDMRATIERGLTFLRGFASLEAFVLVPADHPTLEPTIVRKLLAARQAHPQHSIFVPCFALRRGHPTVIAAKHIDGIGQHRADEGVNRYLRLHEAETLEVEVDSEQIFEDLDTPEDFARLQERFAR